MHRFLSLPGPSSLAWIALSLSVACERGSSFHPDPDAERPGAGGAASAGGAGGAGGAASAGGAGSSTGGAGGGEPRAQLARFALSAQDEHTCVRRQDGKATCWGANLVGQLGLGHTRVIGDEPGEMGDTLWPIDLGAGSQVAAVAAGIAHTCALLESGKVACWGLANTGENPQPSPLDVRGDEPGEMGSALPFVDLGPGARATAIAAGGLHGCALLDDGRVKCWGANASGQLGLGDTESRSLTKGGMGDALPAVDLGPGARAIAVAASHDRSCAVLDTGRVKCWGENGDGRLGLGDTNHRGDEPGEMGDALPAIDLGTIPAVSIAMGKAHQCALFKGGAVKCWGYNADGQLGLGDQEDRVSPGQMGDALPFVDLGTGLGAVSLSLGTLYTCAVLQTGRVKCWGLGGTLGLEDSEDHGDEPGEMGDALPPVNLGAGLTAIEVASGFAHTCVLLSDGRVKCWGLNGRGQLGLGDSDIRGGPGQMGDHLPFVELSALAGP